MAIVASTCHASFARMGQKELRLPDAPASDTGAFLFHPFLHSAEILEGHLRRQLAPLGIRPKQARVLNILDRLGAVSQIELANVLKITEASVSTMALRLTEAGWVAVRRDPGRKRERLLSLTDAGQTKLAEVKTAWREVDRFIIEAIGKVEAQHLSSEAAHLRDALSGTVPARIKASPSASDASE